MKGDPVGDGFSVPSEADVATRLRQEIDAWTPRSRPPYADLMARVAQAPRELPKWAVYPTASLALAAILVIAFLVMATLNISLGATPVQSHLH